MLKDPNPFRTKASKMEALANIVLPVLLDRAGGTVTIRVDEAIELGERLGGLAVDAKHEDGVITVTLKPLGRERPPVQ